jgi:hypothetical protein
MCSSPRGPRWSCVASTIYDDESRRHGAAGSRWRACDDGRAEGGSVVWHHGGVNDMNDEFYGDIYLEDCLVVQWK